MTCLSGPPFSSTSIILTLTPRIPPSAFHWCTIHLAHYGQKPRKWPHHQKEIHVAEFDLLGCPLGWRGGYSGDSVPITTSPIVTRLSQQRMFGFRNPCMTGLLLCRLQASKPQGLQRQCWEREAFVPYSEKACKEKSTFLPRHGKEKLRCDRNMYGAVNIIPGRNILRNGQS